MDIRLVISTLGEDHSTETLASPTLVTLTDALADLYARLGCEASSREVMAEVHTAGAGYLVYSEEPEAAPDSVAAELWEKIETLGKR